MKGLSHCATVFSNRLQFALVFVYLIDTVSSATFNDCQSMTLDLMEVSESEVFVRWKISCYPAYNKFATLELFLFINNDMLKIEEKNISNETLVFSGGKTTILGLKNLRTRKRYLICLRNIHLRPKHNNTISAVQTILKVSEYKKQNSSFFTSFNLSCY